MTNTMPIRRRAALLGPMALVAVLAGCDKGAEGIPVPPPTDFSRLDRPGTPHTALAAPAGYRPRSGPVADMALPVYPVPAARLFTAIQRVAASQPRTYFLAKYDGPMQAAWVVRSAMMNFPDVVIAQVSPAGKDASTLILYSTSRYGYYDFGVNRARLDHWAAALDSALNTQSGS